MTAPTREKLGTWSPQDIYLAASDLDEVRNTFHDSVALAKSAPDRADPTWSGQAAAACRERVSEEADSARRFAVELEDVAETMRNVGRRLEYAKASVENAATDIESDPHGLTVHNDWRVNISPMALIPAPETDPGLVRQAIAERQEQMDEAVRFLREEDAACAQLLSEAMKRAANAGRRLDLAAAFERAAGRLPETPHDWITASMLDPYSDAEKYGGTEANVVMGTIQPVPGRGVVTMDLYIPNYSVFNATTSSIAGLLTGDSVGTDYDLGDFRGPTSDPTIGNARVEIVVDFESGLVVARQNPSVAESGVVGVETPDVVVQQLTSGDVRIGFDATNPLAPVGGAPFHSVKGDVAITSEGDQLRLGGTRSNYPAFEAYHHASDGSVTQLVHDEAAVPFNLHQLGPLVGLPFSHQLGDASLLEAFRDPRAVHSEGMDHRVGAASLGKDTDDVVITPIAPRC